jgi:hypothetical protein
MYIYGNPKNWVPFIVKRAGLLSDLYDIYEPSCRVMGDNSGGRKQRATGRYMAVLEMSKAINEVTKPIYEYFPYFLRGQIRLRPNQLPVILYLCVD